MRQNRLSLILCAAALVCAATACAQLGDTSDDPSRFVIQGSLFDSAEGVIHQDAEIVIAGDRVVCVSTMDECVYPSSTPIHRFEGATILPGLIDLHAHARPAYVGAFLPSGVTTIRDANNTLVIVDSLRSQPGAPRILASGPLIDGPRSTFLQWSETAAPIGVHPLEETLPIIAADPVSAAVAVDSLAAAGVDLIKLYQRLSSPAFEAAVAAAARHDLPVAVDLGMVFTGGLHGSEVDIIAAAQAGVSTLEHLSGLALAYQRAGGDPFERPFEETILDSIARAVASSDAAAVPTLATLMQASDPHALSWSEVPGSQLVRHLEPEWNRFLEMAGAAPAAVEADRDLTIALLQRLYRLGVVIGAGSDVPAAPYMVPGGGLHLELEALVLAGLSPAEALQAATLDAASILRRDDLGRLVPGAKADIVVVTDNPVGDIRATREIEAVWLSGRAVDLPAAWQRAESALTEAVAREQ